VLVIVGMAICGMTFMAATLALIAGFKMPKGRRMKFCAGSVGLYALAAVLFVWSLSFIGPS
jgi:metal-dependent HD superfamily phosphatase/phosphodiesterase